MESDFNATSQVDPRAKIIQCQEDLRNTGLPDAANLLRDALQAFLGANSDLERVAERTAHAADRDSNGVPVSERERIERVLPEFWNCLDAVKSAIQNLPADLVGELKSLTSDDAWASRLRQAVHAIEQPWNQTRFCRKYLPDAVIKFVQLADLNHSFQIRNALVWLSECDAPYGWPETLEAVRNLSPEDAGKRLSSEQVKELVRRYTMFQQTFARYRILDTPETRNGVEIPGVGLRGVSDTVSLNHYAVEAITSDANESLLQQLFRGGMLLRLPGQAVSMIAIRDAFCGRRTYLPGEAFETDSETASRLQNAGQAVPADQYSDWRLIRVEAHRTLEYDGTSRMAGSEFDAANRDAIELESSGKVKILHDASDWVLIRNPISGNERWWPSEVWATLLAGNLLAIAVEQLQETVQKLKARLKERGLPRECDLSPESVRKDWLPYQLIPIREHLPDELHEVWTRCHHFELMVGRLPKLFDCGEAWKQDCITAAFSILNSIMNHTGMNPALNVPAFMRAIHHGNQHEGLDRIQKIRALLEPLRGYSRRTPPEQQGNESGHSPEIKNSDNRLPEVVVQTVVQTLTVDGTTREIPEESHKIPALALELFESWLAEWIDTRERPDRLTFYRKRLAKLLTGKGTKWLGRDQTKPKSMTLSQLADQRAKAFNQPLKRRANRAFVQKREEETRIQVLTLLCGTTDSTTSEES